MKKLLLDKVWDGIVGYMDDDIREKVHFELAPCTNLEFFHRYLELDPEFPLDEFPGLEEELDAIWNTKYWVDLDYMSDGKHFALRECGTNDEVLVGWWEDLGIDDPIGNPDPMYQDKLDKYIEEELGFLPDYEIN